MGYTSTSLQNRIVVDKLKVYDETDLGINPVKAGWVEKPEDYLYSSARSYAGLRPLIEIDSI